MSAVPELRFMCSKSGHELVHLVTNTLMDRGSDVPGSFPGMSPGFDAPAVGGPGWVFGCACHVDSIHVYISLHLRVDSSRNQRQYRFLFLVLVLRPFIPRLSLLPLLALARYTPQVCLRVRTPGLPQRDFSSPADWRIVAVHERNDAFPYQRESQEELKFFVTAEWSDALRSKGARPACPPRSVLPSSSEFYRAHAHALVRQYVVLIPHIND